MEVIKVNKYNQSLAIARLTTNNKIFHSRLCTSKSNYSHYSSKAKWPRVLEAGITSHRQELVRINTTSAKRRVSLILLIDVPYLP